MPNCCGDPNCKFLHLTPETVDGMVSAQNADLILQIETLKKEKAEEIIRSRYWEERWFSQGAELGNANRLLGLWREYHAFLNKANEGAISLAYLHHWRCPDAVYQKGIEYRKQLGIEPLKDPCTCTPEKMCGVCIRGELAS